jgi:hypothetical protein
MADCSDATSKDRLSRLVLFDIDWNPANDLQAMGQWFLLSFLKCAPSYDPPSSQHLTKVREP